MTETDTDGLLDGLLADILAPDERPIGAAFVSQVAYQVAELERDRCWRRSIVHRFTTQLLSIVAVGGTLALVSLAPDRAVTIGPPPGLIWPGLLVMLLCWITLAGVRPRLIT